MSRKSKIIFSFKTGSVKIRKKPVKATKVETPKVQYKRIKRVGVEEDDV